MIKRIIARQYEQLDEMCKQTLAEIDDLNFKLSDTDFSQRVEIQRTRELISSIEKDVKVKRQEIQRLEIRTRYDQLINIYEQTREEVQLLEMLLENNVLNRPDIKASNLEIINNLNDLNQPQQVASLTPDFGIPPQNQRLDLTDTTVQATSENQYSHVLKKWQESLSKIDSIPKTEPVELISPEPEPIIKEVPVIPVIPVSLPVEPLPPTPEIPVLPPAPKLLPEIPVIPVSVVEEPPSILENTTSEMVISKPKTEKGAKPKKSSEQDDEIDPDFVPLTRAAKSARMIINGLFVLVLIIAVAFVILVNFVNAEAIGESSKLFGNSFIVMNSDVMPSTVPPRSILVVNQNVEVATMQRGDFVAFMRPNEAIVVGHIHSIYPDFHGFGIDGIRLIGDPQAIDGLPEMEVHRADAFVGEVTFSNLLIGMLLQFGYYHITMVAMFFVCVLVFLFLLKGGIAPKPKKIKVKKSSKHDQ